MTDNIPDYLVIGSGLSSLAFSSLMAAAGRSVRVLEAHYLPGGYGHTFEVGDYRFNAQLHYVWNCGEGRTVYRYLDKLGLLDEVVFNQYDSSGFDRMRMPGYALDIPYDMELLKERMAELFPGDAGSIGAFLDDVKGTAEEIDSLPTPVSMATMLPRLARFRRVLRYRNSTLQDVFDRFELPQAAQTLLALQWPDFLAPPKRLSFFAWVMLFRGYQGGAYYPQRHFEHVIDNMVAKITGNGGELLLQHKVVDFIMEGGRVVGVRAQEVGRRGEQSGALKEFRAKTVVCNMDPRRAAEMVGMQHFPVGLRKKLDYRYSASNFMAYCAVDIDMRDYGFGKSNTFHTEDPDLNRCFDAMRIHGDYSRPSFVMTVPSLLTEHRTDCPEGQQIVELLTVADYGRFRDLKFANARVYNAKKQEIFDALCDIIERDYVPDFRKHIRFKMLGSPTTNERYCLSPQGNSYGAELSPDYIGAGRLDHKSGVDGLYFCNATAGFAGFTGAVWTGSNLYEQLTGDRFLG